MPMHTKLLKNALYKYLVQEFRGANRFEWDTAELIDQFGYKLFQQCMKQGVLVFSNPAYRHTVRLAFKKPNHISANIIHLCRGIPLELERLHQKFSRESRPSISTLEGYIAILKDFGQLTVEPLFLSLYSIAFRGDARNSQADYEWLFVQAS